MTLDLIARLSCGSPLPDGYRPSAPITCAILSAEDDPNDTITPRLIAAGADLDRVFILGSVWDEDGIPHPWTLPNHVTELRRYVEENEIGLVAIDPLSAFIASSVDSFKETAVRGMLLPLAIMAKSTGCAVLGVRHVRKGATGDARDAGSGSGAFTAAARVEWIIGRDPQDQTRHIIATTKINIAPDPPSLAYRLVAAECEWETVAVRWDGFSDITANQLTAEAASDDERSALDEAVHFLTELLSDGPVAAKIATREANDADITGATLRRAKQRLGIKSRKERGGASGWIWEMTQSAHQDVHVGSVLHLEHVDHLPCSEREFNNHPIRAGNGKGAQGAQELSMDSAMSILSGFAGTAASVGAIPDLSATSATPLQTSFEDEQDDQS